MSRDAHVRICESLGVKFPRATRLVISITGRKHWLWRAVDQDGYVLDEIVQSRRDTKAARRLLMRLPRKQGLTPKRIITDKLPVGSRRPMTCLNRSARVDSGR